jgi:hypothetical protein
MQVNPYLNFDGNCAEAMRFYAEVLGGKDLRVMTFRDSPMAEQIAANEKDMASSMGPVGTGASPDASRGACGRALIHPRGVSATGKNANLRQRHTRGRVSASF